ncbi:hypothetical protein [Crossiella cryophila]|uniref:Uncharacterized protein n=1 Tax=Crossiella cryophila TaxID=43355 RepID=A0A7W7CB54_9PSEU|nr:hypothetical protein [Crossiella cryophila]MBB4677909.1 hypothetical protein [Crossiella cryophila]
MTGRITPKIARGGFVLVEPRMGREKKVITFQYNPDTLTRTLRPQTADNPGDRLESLRLKGPAQETYKFDAEFDAADQLDQPERYRIVAEHGLHPILAALEMSFSPTVKQLTGENNDARIGLIDIAPVEAPLTLLVLGAKRVLPVRITEFSVTEEAFDTALNPIRAKVSVGAQVLTVDDLGFDHRGGQLYLRHQTRRELFADLVTDSLGAVGLPSLPGV